jgi:hypothetical protein
MRRIYELLVEYQLDGVLLFNEKYVNHSMYINFKRLVFGEFTPFKRDINPSHE